MKIIAQHTLALIVFCPAMTLAAPISETRPMAADGRVSFEMLNGTATIRGWDRDEFSIEGEISDNAAGYELSVRDGNISFEEEYEQGSQSCWFGGECRNGNRSESRYEIFVPEGAELGFEGINVKVDVAELVNGANIEVVNGDILLSSVSGLISLETVNGNIRSRDLNGRISMATVNGNIEDSDSQAPRASFETVNGNIQSDVMAPRIEAETVNGRIELNPGAIDELETSSVNGDLVLTLSLNSGAELEVNSFGGDISLALPVDTSARFEAETNSGSIRNALTEDAAREEGRFRKNSVLNFTLNGGSALVEVTSFSGDIRIEAQ